MEGDARGIFPRQPVGPGRAGEQGQYALEPLAVGPVLHIAPESERQRMTIRSLTDAPLALLDGRAEHNNGWFVVRSLVPAGTTQGAIRWRVSPHAVPGFLAETVVQVSQVGYLPGQRKVAVVEMDREQRERPPVRCCASIRRAARNARPRAAASPGAASCAMNYTTFDFSGVTEPGIYVVACGEARSNPFLIGGEVYDRYVWQPTLEYFLPVQMCHMRVCEGYRSGTGLPPGRRPHGAGESPALRRLRAGALHPHPSSPASTSPASMSALARRGRLRPARRVAGRHVWASRSRGRSSGPASTTRRSTRRSATSRSAAPTAGPTSSSRTSTAC
jgi:hypothetical protein